MGSLHSLTVCAFDRVVVADATAAHERTARDGDRIDPEMSHRVALAYLNEEFVTVVDAADLG